MSTSSRDALQFKAKRDVVVLGFGCTGPRASEHPTQLLGWSHSIKYKANDIETETVVFTAETPAEIEGALVNLFDVYFSEIGLPDCELAEG